MDKIEYKYGSKTIVAEVLYSNRKTLDLRVFPEGNVQITAPLNTPLDIILEKVKPKLKWVIQQQKAFELYRPFTSDKIYIPGETHRYLGRQYKLKITKKEKGYSTISLAKGLMHIETTKENVETIITKFYKSKADVVFSELLQKLLEEFPRFKEYEISLSHKFLKKRWGSCATNGNILLNTELIKASKICIEYVIIHELCHLIHPNHSKYFYELLSELLPNWQNIKHKLETTLA